jgi:hypothetical protein
VRTECTICHQKHEAAPGSFRVCSECVRVLVSAWAREYRRRSAEKPPTPPTAPPSGDTAPAELAVKAA